VIVMIMTLSAVMMAAFAVIAAVVGAALFFRLIALARQVGPAPIRQAIPGADSERGALRFGPGPKARPGLFCPGRPVGCHLPLAARLATDLGLPGLRLLSRRSIFAPGIFDSEPISPFRGCPCGQGRTRQHRHGH
jgi:hypothetical protein